MVSFNTLINILIKYMDPKEHTTPAMLQRYAFLWMMACLALTALSLFFGATPIAFMILGSSAYSLLNLSWLISGIASAYLGYIWFKGDKTVFGTSDQKTKILFLIMVVTGLNIGLVAFLNQNILMNLVWGHVHIYRRHFIQGSSNRLCVYCLHILESVEREWRAVV